MKDGQQPIDTNLNELIKMVSVEQINPYTQEQIIQVLQQQFLQQILPQQINNQQGGSSQTQMSSPSSSSCNFSSSTLEGMYDRQSNQSNEYVSRRFMIGGFGTNGYDSSSYAMEFLYDLLGENDRFEFLEQVKQSWEDIDNYIKDLEEEIKKSEKQGIEIIYIHFTVNNTPFIRLEKCAYNTKALTLPQIQYPFYHQTAKSIDANRLHNASLQSYLSFEYINTFLNSDQYWVSQSINPGLNSNNYLYYHALNSTKNKALLINLPSLLNENKENISIFLQDFISSLV